MKKMIPIISLLGASALVVGASNLTVTKQGENYINYFNSFQADTKNFSKIDTKLVSSTLNKYTLSLNPNPYEENCDYCPSTTHTDTTSIVPDLEPVTQYSAQTDGSEHNDNITNELQNNVQKDSTTTDDNTNIKDNIANINNNLDSVKNSSSEIVDEAKSSDKLKNETTSKLSNDISTLYSLSNDITESCDAFCELKAQLHDAIIETQTLIKKVRQNEINLTSEQKLLITEQAQQLKNLGRQLSNSTTELSISLSDLNSLMQNNNTNMEDLSLKYLIVLNNLVNENEMLHSSLATMRLMNQMFNVSNENIPSNNKGRILYGFQENNNPPIIKDYYIDENNEIQENKGDAGEENTDNNDKTNIDTYQNRKLQSNIDTYQNSPVNRNIDTFFNTALLDNEFMYGNGNGGLYGYGGYAGNPYMNNYSNYERGNTNDSVNNDIVTQNKDTNIKKNSKKDKLKLTKNIDTYKDENTPTLRSRIENLKSNIGDFFSKFSKADLDDKINNPIYKFNNSSEDSN